MKRDYKRILWQLAGNNDWRVVQEVDNFMFSLNSMTRNMRVVVEYRLDGYTVEEISFLVNKSEGAVRTTLSRAKKYILSNLKYPYQEELF